MSSYTDVEKTYVVEWGPAEWEGQDELRPWSQRTFRTEAEARVFIEQLDPEGLQIRLTLQERTEIFEIMDLPVEVGIDWEQAQEIARRVRS